MSACACPLPATAPRPFTRPFCQQLDDFNDYSAPSGGSQGDFLARERELLGDEFGPTPTDLPSASEFEDKPKGSSTTFPELDDMPSSGAAAPSTTAAKTANDDFMSSFERDPAPEEPSSSTGSAQKSQNATVVTDDGDDQDDAVQQFESQYPDVQIYPAVQQPEPVQPTQQEYQVSRSGVCAPVTCTRKPC